MGSGGKTIKEQKVERRENEQPTPGRVQSLSAGYRLEEEEMERAKPIHE
jgi:hypothetical protein